MTTLRRYGLAHFTLLDLTPPELVEVAGTAGYDFVGLRIHAITPGERQYPVGVGSAMLRETKLRLDDHGVSVNDVDGIYVTSRTTRDDWMPALDTGAELGASALGVIGGDTDEDRLTDVLCLMARDAADRGLRPALEPISYQPVRTIQQAVRIARRANILVLADVLHVMRSGSGIDSVGSLGEFLAPQVQISDAPDEPLPVPLVSPSVPLGMVVGDDPLKVESRTGRLPPGTGALPLRAFLRNLPEGAAVSVEVPNQHLEEVFGPSEFARMNLVATKRLEQSDRRYG